MTFIIKTTGAGGFLLAEYRCPLHGVFEATVQRNETGDAPDEQPCPASLADGPRPHNGESCGVPSPWTISAPLGKVKRGEVTKGKSAERPPGALDTSKIADGMPTGEWRERRAKLRKEQLRKTVKEKTGW